MQVFGHSGFIMALAISCLLAVAYAAPESNHNQDHPAPSDASHQDHDPEKGGTHEPHAEPETGSGNHEHAGEAGQVEPEPNAEPEHEPDSDAHNEEHADSSAPLKSVAFALLPALISLVLL